MTHTVLDTLIAILNQQLGLYAQLLQLAKEEQLALTHNKSETLMQLLEREDEVIVAIEDVERRRRHHFDEVAQELGIERGSLTLQKLIGRVVEPYSTEFELKYNQLAEIIDQLTNVNQLNTELINNCLDYSQYMMNLITQVSTANHYVVTGEMQGNRNAPILDRRS